MVNQKKYSFKISLTNLEGLEKQKNKNRFINDAIKSKLDEQELARAVWEKLKEK